MGKEHKRPPCIQTLCEGLIQPAACERTWTVVVDALGRGGKLPGHRPTSSSPPDRPGRPPNPPTPFATQGTGRPVPTLLAGAQSRTEALQPW